MATGGTASDSVKGSDEYYVRSCSPCARSDKDIQAEVYCWQCKEYLCRLCLVDHNKFAMMSGHKLLDQSEMEELGQQEVRPVLTVQCDEHPGNMYSSYCGSHDRVCCGVCIAKHHKSCDTIQNLLDTCKGTELMKEANDFEQTLVEIVTELELVRSTRNEDIGRIDREKIKAMEKIRCKRQVFKEKINDLETSAICKVTSAHESHKACINRDINALEDMKIQAYNKMKEIKEAKDETEKFVYLKKNKEIGQEGTQLLKRMKSNVGKEHLVLLMNTNLERHIAMAGCFADLLSPSLQRQHNVLLKSDKETPVIQGICHTTDGNILLADWKNKCIKRFDTSFKLIDRVGLCGGPFDMCQISDHEVAVTIEKTMKVQFVTISNKLSISKAFNTTDRCRGIVFHFGHLYIACGGDKNLQEDQAHISVYSLAGKLLRKLKLDRTGELLFASALLGIAVLRDKNVIIVCDRDNGLVAMDDRGDVLWRFVDPEMRNLTAVCINSHGHVVCCGRDSSKVMVVSIHGRKLGMCDLAGDGIISPVSLGYIKRTSQLVVGMVDNDLVAVYKI